MPIINYKSKVSANSPNSARTTIPQGVMSVLDLDVGNTVIWEVEVTSDGINVSVKKDNE